MIVDTIKAIVQTLSPSVEFVYGNLFESNFELDQLASATGWYYVYIPPLENTDDIGLKRELHTSFPLQAFIVKRLEKETTDYKSEEVQPTIDEAREIARSFIHKLNESSIIDHTDGRLGITQVRFESVYAIEDQHLFGVGIQANVPIYEGKTGC